MTKTLNLGVAGLGTVGAALLDLIDTHSQRLQEMLGREIRVTGVSARSREKAEKRISGLHRFQWFDDPVALATDPSIDVFVELIGGENGVAKDSIEAALSAKKHVVTANKALLAKHGVALASRAEDAGVALNFEAAVAGGIPVIKMMREALAANKVRRVYGILNGTCNYIISKMTDEKLQFSDVLRDAQEKGYAEADPTFDIGGFDAAHKLSLLTMLAFGTTVNASDLYIEGIQSINEADIQAASDLGYCIKLLGIASEGENGIEVRVGPVMIEEESALAEVWGVTNCVGIDGDYVGNVLVAGPGAGGDATASAVASDIVDVARGFVLPPFIRPAKAMTPIVAAPLSAHVGNFYVRLSVHDRPGVMAAITARMSEQNVSLESLVQKRPGFVHPGQAHQPPPGSQDGPVNIVLLTHGTTEEAVRKALSAIENDGKVTERPQLIRIEEF